MNRMNLSLKWLKDVTDGPWSALAEAARDGLPVPLGFVVSPPEAEDNVRRAYEEIVLREHTHFVAVRGPSHALLDVIGPDRLIHSMRRLWAESPNGPLLVQRMVNSNWCGNAKWEGKNLRIKANEGLMVLDPDTFLFNTGIGKCSRKSMLQKQRKMFRWVDGTSRTVDIQGDRLMLGLEHLQAIAELAAKAESDISWALDDRQLWLISTGK